MSDAWTIYLKLGWRNLWLHPLRTGLTSAALAVGIAALTFLSAMDDGWMQQIKVNFALTITGHIQIHKNGFELTRKLSRRMEDPETILNKLAKHPGIEAVTQRIRVSGLASSAGANGGALIYGIDPVNERKISRLAKFIRSGHWLRPGDVRGIVLGDGLAKKLGIDLGDKVVLMAAAPSGEIVSEVFRVRGLIHSGVMDVDDLTALIPLNAAQHWLGIGKAVTDIVIRCNSFEEVTPLATELGHELQSLDLEVLRWNDIDPMAEQWAQFADAYTWVVLAIVILVVLAEVLNTMLMSLHERIHEFGLMGALGVMPAQIFFMVLWETVILVLIGAVAGFVLGGSLALWYGQHGIDLTRFAIAFSFMYMDPVVYPMLRAESCLRILGAAIVGAMVAALIPAYRASKLEPAVALKEI